MAKSKDAAGTAAGAVPRAVVASYANLVAAGRRELSGVPAALREAVEVELAVRRVEAGK